MAEKDAKPKKHTTIKQIIQIYKYTAKEDKALPWLEAGAFLLPAISRARCDFPHEMLFPVRDASSRAKMRQ